MRTVALCFLGLALRAQTPKPPDTYTVTSNKSFFGPAVESKVYRIGSKAVVATNGMLTLFDLQAHTSLSWNPADLAAPCGQGTFSGDWGDPFAMSGELGKEQTRPIGTEKVAGLTANILEADTPQGKFTIWKEPKSNLILKLEMTAPTGGDPKTLIEVTAASFAPPPAALFTPPASCRNPPPPDFSEALLGPASANSCTVLFRVVRAGSMEPVTNFQVAVDPYSGGGLRELTSQLTNGVLRIDNAPAQFHIETAFGNAGTSSALIYRQCSSPETVLLFVLKNPANLSDGGDWYWVKSGKYATLP